MRIGERIAELRREAGFTQETLAEAAGVNRRNLENYEAKGRRTEPDWWNFLRLALALGKRLEDFADCKPEGKPAPRRKRGKK